MESFTEFLNESKAMVAAKKDLAKKITDAIGKDKVDAEDVAAQGNNFRVGDKTVTVTTDRSKSAMMATVSKNGSAYKQFDLSKVSLEELKDYFK